MQLSERVQHIKPSSTLAMAAKATALRAQGKDILPLGVGEPDFDTPDHIKRAAIEAIQKGLTKYTAPEGLLELRRVVANKFEQENHLRYDTKQIIISCGGKQCFYNMAQAFLNPGDEAIIPAPYWVSFPDMVQLAGGIPVFLQTDFKQAFKITPAKLEAAITPKTRLFVINSPSNPTGIAYTREELRAIGDVLMKHPQILIATDDMYEHIYWGREPFCNIINACPALYDRTIVLNAVSKTYAMTGWRIGYAAGPADLIQAMITIQGQSTSNPCSIAQAAAKAALEGSQDCVRTMVRAFKERHDRVVEGLNALPGIECLPGDGTFYVFPNVEQTFDRLEGVTDDYEFCDFLLDKHGIALTPGSAFGTPGHIRLSYATSMENLDKALARLKTLLA